MDPRHAVIIKDLIITPPADAPYITAKKELLKRLDISQDVKTRKLLEDQVLGDKKPSEFLRHLRDLGGESISENLLRTLWLGRLPTNVQVILATQQDATITKTAELADGIMETLRGAPQLHQPNIAAMTPAINVVVEAMTAQMSQLTSMFRQEIAEVRREFRADRERSSRQQTRNRSASRRRSQSRGDREFDQCWYHWKFGAEATKCKKPCKFAGNEPGAR